MVVGGGGWVLDFTKLIKSHLPTKVEVEVEDELGNIPNDEPYMLKTFGSRTKKKFQIQRLKINLSQDFDI